jgi:hypothetical protein
VRSPLRCIAGRGRDIPSGTGEPFRETSGSVLRKQQVGKSTDNKIEA